MSASFKYLDTKQLSNLELEDEENGDTFEEINLDEAWDQSVSHNLFTNGKILPIVENLPSGQIMSSPKSKPVSPMKSYHSKDAGAISPVSNEAMESSSTPYKYTNRSKFDDENIDRNDVAWDQNSGHGPFTHGKVIPVMEDLESVHIMSSPKSKPATPMKTSHCKGEVLTPEKAIEFMIKERQSMDSEYATLRKQNFELKSELERRSTDMAQPQSLVKSLKKVDHSWELEQRQQEVESKWRAETERVQQENEQLKRRLKENEEKMRVHDKKMLQSVMEESSEQEDINLYSAISTPEQASHQRVSHRHQAYLSREAEDSDEDAAPLNKVTKRAARVQLDTELVPELSFKRSDSVPADLPIEMRRFLWEGSNLWKVPYTGGGFPERRVVMLRRERSPSAHSRSVRLINDDGSFNPIYNSERTKQLFMAYPITIMWYTTGKPGDHHNIRELVLNREAHIIPGHGTPAFWKLANTGQGVPNVDCCFSIVSHTRTLDFVADTKEQALQWMDGLEDLLAKLSGKRKNDSAIRKKCFSFRGEEVEASYAPQHQSKSRADTYKTMDMETVKRQMFAAAIAGDYDILRDILEAGVSVNLMEPIRKDTPLMIACRAGNTEMVRLCLHYGAKNDPHPDFGHTALHAAVLCSQLGAVSVLLEAAAASDADAAIANLADPSGQTPLHMAAERGLMSVMELLLSHGADIKRHDGAGRTAIHICSSLGHRKCLAVLLDHSGDSLIEETDNFGQTALHTAADNGQLSCTRLLLETAAEVGCRNSAGKTPYMLANSKGHYQVAQVLHEYSQNFTSNSSAPVSHTPFSSHQRSYNTSTLPGPADKYLGNLASPTSAHSPKLFRDHSDSKLQRCAIDEILPRPHTSAPSPKPSPSASTFTRKIPLFSGNAVSISTSSYFNDNPRDVKKTPLRSFSETYDELELELPYPYQENDMASPMQTTNHNIVYDSEADIAYTAEQEKLPPLDVGISQQLDHSQAREAWSPTRELLAEDFSEEIGTATEIFYPALEEFSLDGIDWSVYSTDDGDVYYLNSDAHSQWGDPRIYGMYVEEEAVGEMKPSSRPPSPRGSPSGFPLQSSPEKYKEKQALCSLSTDASDSENDEAPVLYVRTPIKSHHATYKTPRRDKLRQHEAKPESMPEDKEGVYEKGCTVIEDFDTRKRQEAEDALETEDDGLFRPRRDNVKLALLKKAIAQTEIPMLVSNDAVREEERTENFDLDEKMNRYLLIIQSGESLRDVRRLMESEGKSREDVWKMISLLDEFELKIHLDESFIPEDSDSDYNSPDLMKIACAGIPEDRLMDNIWRMGRFNPIAQNQKSSNDGFTSPRHKLILYNVTIGLTQLKTMGTSESILDAVCTLDTIKARITVDHLENLLNLLPRPGDLDQTMSKPLTGHPSEAFLKVAFNYYPELPNRIYTCLICGKFSSEYNSVKSKCKTLIDGCNQVLSSILLANVLDKAVGRVNEPQRYVLNELMEKVNQGVRVEASSALCEDLTLTHTSAELSSTETLGLIESFSAYVSFLESERRINSIQPVICDAISEVMSKKYLNNLGKHLDVYSEQVSELLLLKTLLRKKVAEINLYFGEDASIDSSKVFSTLSQFVNHIGG